MAVGQLNPRIADRWQRLAGGSVNRRIFGAASIVAALTFVGALATMAKDLLVAASFGTRDALDAFLIALLLPTLAVNVVAGSFGAALVPTYVRIRDLEGHEAAGHVFAGFLALSLGLLLGAVAILALVGPAILPFFASGFGLAKLHLVERLYYMLLPIVVLAGLAMIAAAILNANEKFALAAITPVAIPLAASAALLAFGRRWGIFAFTAGVVGGYAVHFFLLARALHADGAFVLPRWHGLAPELREVAGQYLPMAVGSLMVSSTPMADQAIAASLGSGSVALLSYGNKVVGLTLLLSATAVKTAALPYFSRLVAERKWPELRHTIATYTRLILVVVVPLTVILVTLATPIMRFLFARGAFTGGDARAASSIQAMYALQIPFAILENLLIPLLSSLRANRALMRAAAIGLPLNLALDIAFIHPLGVAGIALSTSVVHMVSLAFLAVYSWRIIRNLEGER